MGFRCELCDEWLPMLQFSHLCPTCYKIRTIVKCYNADTILSCLEDNFKISKEEVANFRKKDLVFYKEEEVRMEKEIVEELKQEQYEAEVKTQVANKEAVKEELKEKTNPDSDSVISKVMCNLDKPSEEAVAYYTRRNEKSKKSKK
tara:strand:- start:1047 stop:1484 length:438 start_codon:yes stop_codon:yes gene_type:complete